MVKGRRGGPGRAGEHAQSRAKGAHSHGGISRQKTKAKKRRPQSVHLTDTQRPIQSAAAASSCNALGDGERILLLGEGDFGFAAALALGWGQCPKLTATSLASESSTLASYPEAEDNIETIKAFGGKLVFKVDATALDTSALGGKKGFDKILFNFPATDSCSSNSSNSSNSIEAHQSLLRGLFKSVLSGRLLKEATGELHVTTHTAEAATWKLVEIANIAGLRLKAVTEFRPGMYHGYRQPPGGASMTYILFEPPQKLTAEEEKAKLVAALRKAHPELRIGPTGQTYKEAWKQRHSKYAPR